VKPKLIYVFGEGPHEIGRLDDETLSEDALPALPQLVRRLLPADCDVRFKCRPIKDISTHQVRGVGPSYRKKVSGAVRKACQAGATAAVIVIDRDRQNDRDRIGQLQEGRGSLDPGAYIPCAVGMAVETFDAWMIADADAMSAAMNGAQVQAHPSPESLGGTEARGGHPKTYAAEQLGGGQGLGEKYAVIAQHVHLGRLEAACPQGFRPFAREVREKLTESFGASGSEVSTEA